MTSSSLALERMLSCYATVPQYNSSRITVHSFCAEYFDSLVGSNSKGHIHKLEF